MRVFLPKAIKEDMSWHEFMSPVNQSKVSVKVGCNKMKNLASFQFGFVAQGQKSLGDTNLISPFLECHSSPVTMSGSSQSDEQAGPDRPFQRERDVQRTKTENPNAASRHTLSKKWGQQSPK